jgi:hypothetical protein
MANKQYVLGRGELYFDAMLPNTKTRTGERFIGNVTAFSVSIESETLDHFDSTAGVRQKDDSVLLEINRTGSLTTDNMDGSNFAIFILGTEGAVAQTATPVTGEAINDVTKDRFYQVGATAGNPTGVRGISAVTVRKGVTVLVAGTDYDIDLALGRLYIRPGSVTIVNGDDLTIDYTPAANSREQLKSAAGASIDGSLRFVAKNPKGPVRDVYLPYCRLSPSGELQFIGDEWQAMTFEIDIQKLDDTTEAIYIDGRPQ